MLRLECMVSVLDAYKVSGYRVLPGWFGILVVDLAVVGLCISLLSLGNELFSRLLTRKFLVVR